MMVSDAYSATRMHAMHADLIKARDYPLLLAMNEREILSFLQRTAYREDVDAISLRDLNDLETVDRVIAHHHKRIMARIKRLSSERFLIALGILLRRNDIWNIRIAGIAIGNNSDVEETLVKYGRAGTIEVSAYADAKSIADLTARVQHLYPALRAKTLAELLHDIMTYEMATINDDSIRWTNKYLIDEWNIRALLLLKREMVASSAIVDRLQPGGTLPRHRLLSAIAAHDIEETIDILAKTRYADVMRKAKAFLKDGHMHYFEHELHKEILRRMRRAVGRYPLGADVLIYYFAEKSIEEQNLRLLMKGKRLGLEEGFLRSQLVIW